MTILLGFIMVVSISCSLFYGAASFAYLDLYKEHEYYFKKKYYQQKMHKAFMRYNLLCYKYTIKKFIVSFLICIISLIIGCSTL